MQMTSIEAFHSLKNLGAKQQAVLDELTNPMTNRQLARRLGWEINRVTPRVNELVALGFVTEHGTTIDQDTNKRAILWVRAEKTHPMTMF
jgi:DNA-binding MarR family transcriptional regulator